VATEGTWRPHSFVPGRRYKVVKDCKYFGSQFKAGDILEFDTSGYERYDCTSLFRFYPVGARKDPSGGLVWNLHDNEPDEKIAEFFSEVQ
jgi:hypothetical protein